MKFLVSRESRGPVSKQSPCQGAVRGPESPAWPGEYEWSVEIGSLDELLGFLGRNGGALGLFEPEDGEAHPVIEIFDDGEEN